MLKRLVVTGITVLVLVIGTPLASAATMDGGDGDGFEDRTRRSASDDIWVGLCVGASLDLSGASERRCERRQQVLQEKERRHPPQPPDIEVGLCVGASLDLSRASAAKCNRQVHPHSQTTAPTRTTHSHPQKHHHENTEVVVSQTPATPSPQYAALGDSVAAGAGLSGKTDTTCDRTTQAYAYSVASARGLTVNHLACRGATMRSLYKGQIFTDPGSQLDGAFSAGTPSLITITAGANDIKWDSFLLRCFDGVCGADSDTHAVNIYLDKLSTRTQRVLQEIEQRSGGAPPEVIITGYYNPLSDNCATVDPRVSAEEIAWASSQVEKLNQTLSNATASASFAAFVPVDFAGHDVCSSDPWVQGLNDPAPFHPTAAGQQAIANAIN